MTSLDVDELQLYFGDDYIINDYIKIHQPSIGEVVKYGEASYFSTIHTITAIPSDMKSMLWDMGIDWVMMEDFELFMLLSQTLTLDRTSLLFGDLDFSQLKPYPNSVNGDIVLANKEAGIIIDKMIYLRIVSYLRKLHNITPKIEKAANEMTKKILIEEDRNKIRLNQEKPFKSYLLPLVSSVKTKQGYTKEYVRNMGLYEFFDEISRLSIIDNSNHLLSAAYAGTIDMKKINKNEFNWMRES